MFYVSVDLLIKLSVRCKMTLLECLGCGIMAFSILRIDSLSTN